MSDKDPARRLRLVVADDAAVLREGLIQLLAMRGHTVVAAVADATALRSAVGEHQPDIAIIDIRMPPTFTDEGLAAALELRHEYPALGLMMFSQCVETRYASDLLATGGEGIGYLLKERVRDVGEFVDALQQIACGGTVLDPEVVSQLVGSSQRTDALAVLSPRERRVLALMAEGQSNAAIAQTLVVSERSIEKHTSNIFTKLGLLPTDATNRRVLAAVRFLTSQRKASPPPREASRNTRRTFS